MNELKRILYVEDDTDIQEIAHLALVDVGGFEIMICSDGKDALAKGPDFKPDLILLDVMMPDMDGVATFKAMRKIDALAATPIIFLTAKVQSNEVKEYKGMGALEVIFKPFDPMTISDKIKEIWKRNES